MSQAEAYLNSLTDDVPKHDHIVTDSDSHFVIDPDTRKISNAGQTENVLIQYDHNSEVFTFELPRYIDGHDMTLCNRVRVHYNNVDGKTNRAIPDVAEMTDLRVSETDPSKVVSSWLISRNATQLAGTLNFLIQYLCVDDDDNIVYEWHTDIYDGVYVSSGRRNGKQAVVRYTDVLEQWYQRLFGTGESVMVLAEEKINEITATGNSKINEVVAEANEQIAIAKEEIESKASAALDTIPSEYAELYDYANEAARTKGDAVTHTVEGEDLAVRDSSDDYLRGLRVFGKTTQVKTTGKNLLPYPYPEKSQSANGATVTVNDDGSITFSGTPSDYIGVSVFSGAPIWNGQITITLLGTFTNVVGAIRITDTADSTLLDASITQSYTLDLAAYNNIKTVAIAIKRKTNSTTMSGTVYPMIVAGKIAPTAYEPYSGGIASPSPYWPQELVSIENPTVGVFGKNLLDQYTAYKATGNTAEITKVVNENRLVLTGTPSKSYVQITTGYLTVPITWRGRTLQFGGTVTGNQPHVVLYFRNGSKAIINQVGHSESGAKPIEVPRDAVYYEFAFCLNKTTTGSAFTATYENLYLVLEDDVASYEPYKPVKSIPLTRTLPGIPVSQNGNYTDADGKQWICDEIDFERGVYVQRVNSFNLKVVESTNNPGSWKEDISQYMGTFPKYAATEFTVMCTHGDFGQWFTNNCFYVGAGNRNKYVVGGNRALFGDTVETANAYLTQLNAVSPVMVHYVLETPVYHNLTETELQTFKYIHSNYPSTTVLNDSGAWMEMKYNVDTELFIKNTVPSPTDEQVDAALVKYANNHDIVPDDRVRAVINDYADEHGMATDAQVQAAVTAYANAHGVTAGATQAQAAQIEQNKTVSQTANAVAQAAQSKANEANRKVDTLREVVSKFHSNIVEEVSGEVITVSDSAEAPLQGLKLYGKTKQFTTTGKNLFDVNNRYKFERCTVEGNVISIDVDNTSGTSNVYVNFITSASAALKEGKSYLIVLELLETNSDMTFRVVSVNSGKSDDSQFKSIKDIATTAVGKYFAVVEAKDSFDGCGSMCRGFISVKTGTYVKCKFRISVLEDTTVNESNFVYEPYTGGIPSPNPDYPQALESVGDDGSVNVYVGYEPTVTSVLTGANVLSNGVVDNSATATNFDLLIYELSDTDTVNVKPDAGQYVIGFFANIPTVGSVTVDGSRVVTTPNEYKTVPVPYGAKYVCVRTASGLRTTPVSVNKTLTISTPNGLPGIPVESGGNYTDSTGKQWLCDEVDFEKGVYVQRVKNIVLKGTESIILWNTSKGNFNFTVSDLSTTYDAILCSHLSVMNGADIYGGKVTNAIASNKQYRQIGFAIDGYTTVDSVKAYLANEYNNGTPVGILYVLKAEKTTALTEEQLAAFAELYSHYPSTTVYNDDDAGMSVKYIADTKLYVDKKFAELAAAIINNT